MRYIPASAFPGAENFFELMRLNVNHVCDLICMSLNEKLITLVGKQIQTTRASEVDGPPECVITNVGARSECHEIPFSSLIPSILVTLDTSILGWGAHLNNIVTIRDVWSPAERKMHINVLEQRTIQWALKSLLPQISHKVVQVATVTIQ